MYMYRLREKKWFQGEGEFCQVKAALQSAEALFRRTSDGRSLAGLHANQVHPQPSVTVTHACACTWESAGRSHSSCCAGMNGGMVEMKVFFMFYGGPPRVAHSLWRSGHVLYRWPHVCPSWMRLSSCRTLLILGIRWLSRHKFMIANGSDSDLRLGQIHAGGLIFPGTPAYCC